MSILPDLGPDIPHKALLGTLTEQGLLSAFDEAHRSFQREQDVFQGDVPRRPRRCIPALGISNRVPESCILEQDNKIGDTAPKSPAAPQYPSM